MDGEGHQIFTRHCNRTGGPLETLCRTTENPTKFYSTANLWQNSQQYPLGRKFTSPPRLGQWLATKEGDGSILKIFHITRLAPLEATTYFKATTEQLLLAERNTLVPPEPMEEVRILKCGGPKQNIIEYNPSGNPPDDPELEHTLWIWGNDWLTNLEWDLKDWQWRRIGILAEAHVLNYTTKRGYRVALQ